MFCTEKTVDANSLSGACPPIFSQELASGRTRYVIFPCVFAQNGRQLNI